MNDTLEIEKLVLGSILLDNTKFDIVAQTLTAADFQSESNRRIFEACQKLHAAQKPIEGVFVADVLAGSDGDTRAEWIPILARLTDQVPNLHNIQAYVDEVKNTADKRRILQLLDKARIAAGNGELDPGAIAAKLAEYFGAFKGTTRIAPVAERFIVHWAAEALEPQPEIPWIVRNLICEGSVAIFVGDAGTKKTWSLLDLAVSVALGEPWCGITTWPRTILLVDEESGPRRLKRRLGDVMRGHNAGPDLRAAWTCFNVPDFRNPGDRLELTKRAQEVGAGLIIVDALADIMLGGDENSVQDLQPVASNLRRLAEEIHAAVVLIHHTNRQGKFRGSSSLKGAVDSMFMVESEADSDRVLFRCEKSRDALIEPWSATARFEPGFFRLDPVGTIQGAKKLTPAQQYVLRHLRKERVATVKEIMSHADTCQPGTARNALYSLVVLKMVYRSDLGGAGSEATYKLVSEDMESSSDH